MLPNSVPLGSRAAAWIAPSCCSRCSICWSTSSSGASRFISAATKSCSISIASSPIGGGVTMRREVWFALGMLIAVGVLAQALPDIGEILYRSRDYRNVSSGCLLKYDKDRHEFVCASTGSGVLGTVVAVTLSPGVSTTVANADVTATAHVSCGCGEPGGPGAVAACNTGGLWIRGVHVASTTTGSFVIGHGFAEGDETVTCVITDA